MAVPYERFEDQIEVENSDEISISDEEPDQQVPTGTLSFQQIKKLRYQAIFSERWPRQIGVLQIISGFILTLAAVIEMVALPLIRDTTGGLHIAGLNQSNCYGLGLWTGALLAVTGSFGLRASIYKSVTAIYTYFSLILIDCLVFTMAVLLLIAAYSRHWMSLKAYQDDVVDFSLQITVAVLILIGYILVILAFTQYYEDVFCGDLQCCKRTVHCCLPCCCPKPVTQEELLAAGDFERPPNIPV